MVPLDAKFTIPAVMASMSVVAQDAFAHIQTFVNSLALLEGGSPSFWVDARERFDTETAWARDQAAWPEWLSQALQTSTRTRLRVHR